jgi:predicted amidohydrolase YtcJ
MAARVAATGYAHPRGRLFVGGVKEFADGSLGSRTALMRDDYAGEPGVRGVRMAPLERLRRDAAAADAAGLQIAVHAIGDQAVDEVLDVFEGVIAARGALGGRAAAAAAECALRVEHAQHISGPAAAARFGALAAGGVAAIANPQHLTTDAPMLGARLGGDRAGPLRAFAWPALAAAGGRVAAGSDWPVVDARPFESVATAAARTREVAAALTGDDVTAEAALEAALRLHTADSADAAFVMGARVGRLSPGRRADFAVLARSPLAGGGAGAASAEVVSTYVDGRCAFGCGGGGDAGAGGGPTPQ